MKTQAAPAADAGHSAHRAGLLFWDLENTLNFVSSAASHLESTLHALTSAMIECLVAFFRFEHRVMLYPPHLHACAGPSLSAKLHSVLCSYGFRVHSSDTCGHNAADRLLLAQIYQALASKKGSPSRIVIVSGDADLKWGIKAPQLRGKEVYVVSWQTKASRALRQAANAFHSFESIMFRVATEPDKLAAFRAQGRK